MNNIPMNAPMALSTQQGIKTHTRREVKGLTAIATKQIGQGATDDTPSFLFAEKGEKVLVNDILDESHWGYKHGFRYNCQDINKRYDGFYAKEDEVILNTPYKIGQVLWVREPAKVIGYDVQGDRNNIELKYEFLSDREVNTLHDIPERFIEVGDPRTLPKWIQNCQGIPNGCIKEMARTFIRVTNIRVERLNEISEEDAIKEGIERFKSGFKSYGNGFCENTICPPIESFSRLWESINGKNSFDDRWVWVLEFELISKEEAQDDSKN